MKVVSIEGRRSITDGPERELMSLMSCSHKHVVQYFGTYIASKKLWISMELCISSLHTVLQKRNAPLAEPQIAAVCAQLLLGLQHLHSERLIIHRDIKAANLLLSREGHVKLADFGVSAQLAAAAHIRSTVAGTPMWMSPEMIDGVYDFRTDIWSLGITAIELAEMKPPLHHVSSNMRVLFLIPTLPPPTLAKPNSWSSHFTGFINMCLVKDRELRVDAEQALALPFVSAFDTDSRSVILSLIESEGLHHLSSPLTVGVTTHSTITSTDCSSELGDLLERANMLQRDTFSSRRHDQLPRIDYFHKDSSAMRSANPTTIAATNPHSTVTSTGSSSATLDALADETIMTLKRRIQSKWGITCTAQELHFSPNPLQGRLTQLKVGAQDGYTLANCLISGGREATATLSLASCSVAKLKISSPDIAKAQNFHSSMTKTPSRQVR
eukprot:CAMPEP_0119324064 /NCGR_PEP_ID=MMETSP1333-20130426/62277_1 /TAXON_ID=418940 /ORGANISM="Scyphosphaera apsteinii, Strain RCC1455" /LENGTH=439 /DNA_ID=CAMNT_0007331675 /DNA_START=186 /DNA_END=1505 /DNA_ORIENTATION=-